MCEGVGQPNGCRELEAHNCLDAQPHLSPLLKFYFLERAVSDGQHSGEVAVHYCLDALRASSLLTCIILWNAGTVVCVTAFRNFLSAPWPGLFGVSPQPRSTSWRPRLGPQAFEEAKQKQLKNILAAVSAAKPALKAAASILSTMESSGAWTLEDREQVGARCGDAAAPPASSQLLRQFFQDYTNMTVCLSSEVWSVLEDSKESVGAKMDAFANPSEPTCRVFTALLLLSTRTDPTQINAAEKIECYTHKTFLKKHAHDHGVQRQVPKNSAGCLQRG